MATHDLAHAALTWALMLALVVAGIICATVLVSVAGLLLAAVAP